jgi:hypothetical protein
MDIAEAILEFGAWIISGFVRDVYIRDVMIFNDIDVICELNKKSELLQYLKSRFDNVKITRGDDLTCDPSNNVPFCKRAELILVNDVKVDIMYYDSFDDWKSEKSSVDFTHALFYMSKDVLGIQYLPEGYTFIELLNLTRQKKFKHLKARTTTNENIHKNNRRVQIFIERGWKLVF